MERTLVQQNPQWTGKPFTGIAERTVMSGLRAKADMPHIQILTGVRRCGKSTLFRLLMNDMLAAGVPPKAILNVNLDAPAYIPLWDNAAGLGEVVDRAERLTGCKVQYLFLDEVQHVRDWELFVKSAYDMRQFRKIYVTGSNSNLLAGRFASMLAGRYFANEVRPFSLAEVFAAMGVHSVLDGYQNLPRVQKAVSAVIQYGSFPEIVLCEAGDEVKAELLHSYFESIVQKDCIVYNAVRDPHLFYRFVNYMLRNTGNIFSLLGVGKALGSNENTIGNYLDYLCDSYICADIRNFSFSQKESRRSAHKCYCIDNGLIQANTPRFSPDSGHFFENLVYNELVNKGYREIAFAGSQTECDFLAWRDGSCHAFQACYELTEQNRERELRGFATPTVNAASKTLITFGQKEKVGDIDIVSLWEWALS